jgi:hypothetical protein
MVAFANQNAQKACVDDGGSALSYIKDFKEN